MGWTVECSYCGGMVARAHRRWWQRLLLVRWTGICERCQRHQVLWAIPLQPSEQRRAASSPGPVGIVEPGLFGRTRSQVGGPAPDPSESDR